MRLDFASKLDGDGIVKHGRPSLDLSVMLDVSGSMSMSFQDDRDSRNKLNVAKECINGVIDHLYPDDRIALSTFDSSQQTLFDLALATPKNKSNLTKILDKINANGSTDLTSGLSAAFDVLVNASNSQKKGNDRMQRVMFITDMEDRKSVV